MQDSSFCNTMTNCNTFSFRSKASNGDSKLLDLRSKLSDVQTKPCVDTNDSLLRT